MRRAQQVLVLELQVRRAQQVLVLELRELLELALLQELAQQAQLEQPTRLVPKPVSEQHVFLAR